MKTNKGFYVAYPDGQWDWYPRIGAAKKEAKENGVGAVVPAEKYERFLKNEQRNQKAANG